ncbi:hypothetical protein CcI49_28510 [Frankia sp. CcI49]|nr:hypothetical protein CcI49_28510 [Frankia sp. CcI49]
MRFGVACLSQPPFQLAANRTEWAYFNPGVGGAEDDKPRRELGANGQAGRVRDLAERRGHHRRPSAENLNKLPSADGDLGGQGDPGIG